MTTLFLRILDLSIMAGWLILAILLLRLLLKKTPKWEICALWALVAVRLLIPFTIESPYSLLPRFSDQVFASMMQSPENTDTSSLEEISSTDINEAESAILNTASTDQSKSSTAYPSEISKDTSASQTILPTSHESEQENISANDLLHEESQDELAASTSSLNAPKDITLRDFLPIMSWIWLIGTCILLTHAYFRFWQLKKSVSVYLEHEGNNSLVNFGDNIIPVRKCDEVKAAFLLGLLHPAIYVPSQLDEKTLHYVTLHEAAHLSRRDHLWKPLGYILLSIYWFHPLCWVAYVLFCRDMEEACDEKVICHLDHDGMAAYSDALLACAMSRRRIAACPLAFGESDVKRRVKNILNYKKPAFWLTFGTLAVILVLTVCFLTNPKKPTSDEPEPDFIATTESTEPSESTEPTDETSSGWDPDSDRIPTQEELIQYWYDHRDYPIRYNSPAYQRYFSMGMLYKMQTPPENLLEEMDSTELADLLLRYPGGFLPEMAGDTEVMQMSILTEKIGILNELNKREDGPHSILQAISKTSYDSDLLTLKSIYDDPTWDKDNFVRMYVTIYQDQFSDEDVAYYEAIYQERYEKYYSKYPGIRPFITKVVFSRGETNRAQEFYEYTPEKLKALKELWYTKRSYPDYFADAPSGYYSYRLFGNDIQEKDCLDVLNPPTDLLEDLTTKELATLLLKYYYFVRHGSSYMSNYGNITNDGAVDAFMTLAEKNSTILKELLQREDGIPCLLDAYDEHTLWSSNYDSLTLDLYWDAVEEYLACRFIDCYTDRFTEEDIQHYYEIYDKKKPLYDQIKETAVRELFETKLSRQRQ